MIIKTIHLIRGPIVVSSFIMCDRNITWSSSHNYILYISGTVQVSIGKFLSSWVLDLKSFGVCLEIAGMSIYIIQVQYLKGIGQMWAMVIGQGKKWYYWTTTLYSECGQVEVVEWLRFGWRIFLRYDTIVYLLSLFSMVPKYTFGIHVVTLQGTFTYYMYTFYHGLQMVYLVFISAAGVCSFKFFKINLRNIHIVSVHLI